MTGPAFSVCMPYHDNPGMLERQYINYCGLSDAMARGIELVICDDASTERMPNPPFVECGFYPTVRRFRIPPPHVPWSHRVATNIAAHNARGKWLLITDIDHVVPVRTWRWLMDPDRPKLSTAKAYHFERINADGSEYKPHPDTWLFHVSLWEQIKGYDERYRGHYGQNYPFIQRVKRYAPTVVLPVPVIRYSRDDIPDASERVLTRKTEEAKREIARLRREFIADGTFLKDTRGSATYERVEP